MQNFKIHNEYEQGGNSMKNASGFEFVGAPASAIFYTNCSCFSAARGMQLTWQIVHTPPQSPGANPVTGVQLGPGSRF